MSVSWVKFFPNDWLGSPTTRGMPLEARGLYIDLLALQASTSDGSLPPDPSQLRRLVAGLTDAEFESAWPQVESAFPIGADGQRRNEKLWGLWVKSRDRCEVNRENGSRGGQTKSQNQNKKEENKSKSKSKIATANATPTARANALANATPDALANATAIARAPSAPTWRDALRERGLEGRGFDAACERWAAFRREARFKAWPKMTWKAALTKLDEDPELFARSVENSIANGYSGLFRPRAGTKPSHTPEIPGMDFLRQMHEQELAERAKAKGGAA